MSMLNDVGGVVVKESANILKNVLIGFKWIQDNEVWVGISDETSARDGALSNAQLAYLHANGSPVHNIPARPFLEPSLYEETTYKKLNDLIIEGMRMALAGDLQGAQAQYKLAGMAGAAAAQDYITAGGLAPNAPYTIARKGSSQPLIDTGALRQSVTYVIKKK